MENQKQKLARKKFENKSKYNVNSKLNLQLRDYYLYKSMFFTLGILLIFIWIGDIFITIIGKFLTIYGLLRIQDDKGDFW